jgi:hypothetical protein
MGRSIAVEEDAGHLSGHVHSHNGYYAGDFSTTSEEA